MATSILIESTDTGAKKLQKVVTNVNPDASDYDLKEFSKQLNALTTNTYKGTIRVDRDDITLATAAAAKVATTVTANPTSIDLRSEDWDSDKWHEFDIRYSTDAATLDDVPERRLTISGYTNFTLYGFYCNFAPLRDQGVVYGRWLVAYQAYSNTAPEAKDATDTLTFTIGANDEYEAGSVDITVKYKV